MAGINHGSKTHSIYAVVNQQCVGGIIVEQQGEILWIDAIWLEAAYQNQGLGTQLMQQAFLYARDHSVKEVQLNTYFPRALQFFRAHNFDVVAEVANRKYGLTCFLMRKML